jgi:hypothetical protein
MAEQCLQNDSRFLLNPSGFTKNYTAIPIFTVAWSPSTYRFVGKITEFCKLVVEKKARENRFLIDYQAHLYIFYHHSKDLITKRITKTIITLCVAVVCVDIESSQQQQNKDHPVNFLMLASVKEYLQKNLNSFSVYNHRFGRISHWKESKTEIIKRNLFGSALDHTGLPFAPLSSSVSTTLANTGTIETPTVQCLIHAYCPDLLVTTVSLLTSMNVHQPVTKTSPVAYFKRTYKMTRFVFKATFDSNDRAATTDLAPTKRLKKLAVRHMVHHTISNRRHRICIFTINVNLLTTSNAHLQTRFACMTNHY